MSYISTIEEMLRAKKKLDDAERCPLTFPQFEKLNGGVMNKRPIDHTKTQPGDKSDEMYDAWVRGDWGNRAAHVATEPSATPTVVDESACDCGVKFTGGSTQ